MNSRIHSLNISLYQCDDLENDFPYILQLLRSGDEGVVKLENWIQSLLLYEIEALNWHRKDGCIKVDTRLFQNVVPTSERYAELTELY
jgi:hypothetical protein